MGERLWDLWGVEILHGVFLQQLCLHRQIFEKTADRRDFSCAGICTQTVFRFVRVRLLDAVARQIGKEIINLGKCHSAQKCHVNIVDRDFIQLRSARHNSAFQLQKPQKHPQVKIILINGCLRVTADRFMISQKVAQHLRRIRIVHVRHLDF